MLSTSPTVPHIACRARRMSRVRLLLLNCSLALACASLSALTPNTVRGETWKDNTGKFSVEAQFISLQGDKVVLKKANGSTIQVPLARLDAASQEQAKRLAAIPPQPGAEQAPDVYVRELILLGMSADYHKLWHAVPASYQKDIHDVVHSFAQNMDPSLWNNGSGLVKKAVRVLKEKKQFILAHPQVVAAGDAAAKNWDPLVDFLDSAVNSDLTDLEKLKTIDLAQFTAGGGAKIIEKLKVASEASKEFQKVALPAPPLGGDGAGGLPGAPFADLAQLQPSDIKVSTISREGDKAVLKTELGKTVMQEEWVKVEGKWVPSKLAKDWQSHMTEARQWTAGEMK